VYADREASGNIIISGFESLKGGESVKIGTYLGFDMEISRPKGASNNCILTMKGESFYDIYCGNSPTGIFTRIHNIMGEIPEHIMNCKNNIKNIQKQIKDSQEIISKPFNKGDLLQEKMARLNEINIILNNQAQEEQQNVEGQDKTYNADGLREEKREAEKEKFKAIALNTLPYVISFEDAEQDNTYAGKILLVGEECVLQEIQQGKLVFHSIDKISDFQSDISAGEFIYEISYDNDEKSSIKVYNQNSEDLQSDMDIGH
jgi:hypothetical protein